MSKTKNHELQLTTVNTNRKIALLEQLKKRVDQSQQPEQTRIPGNILCFWIITICTSGIPFINMLLLFFQPFQLINSINKEQYTIQNLGRTQNFFYFYIVIGLYALVSFSFILYSCFFSNNSQRIKLYLMVDNILICMLATDIAYAALHIVSFCSVFNTTPDYSLQRTLTVFWQDYVVIGMYTLTNFAYVGIFRILMVNVFWKSWQVILYKLMIIITSLFYVALGLVYIFGADTLSQQIDDFTNQVDPIIADCYLNSTFFEAIPYLTREVTELSNSGSTINNFMIFYVFTNFAFSFQIVAKLTDFDGTSDLKTTYVLADDYQQ